MIIFGKRLSDYVRFSGLFLILIAAAGITRLLLSLSGAPNSTVKWFSMTALVWIGVLYYSVRVHTSGFGAYRHLLPVLVLLNLVAQAIAIIGITIAIVTGNANIYSAPEYAFGGDGKTWLHVAAHLFIGTTMGSLVPWAVGCAILAATRRLAGRAAPESSGFAESVPVVDQGESSGN
jgi:hypothetical protein